MGLIIMPTKSIYIDDVLVSTPVISFKTQLRSTSLQTVAEVVLGNNNGCFVRSFADSAIRHKTIDIYFGGTLKFGGKIINFVRRRTKDHSTITLICYGHEYQFDRQEILEISTVG